MKKQIYIALSILFSIILFNSCTGVKTLATGLENEAFLEFVGNPQNYRNGVDVSIDDNIFFKAEVNKDHANRPKGTVYGISTGQHTVRVSYNNNLVYQKQIFISAQETKRIILP